MIPFLCLPFMPPSLETEAPAVRHFDESQFIFSSIDLMNARRKQKRGAEKCALPCKMISIYRGNHGTFIRSHLLFLFTRLWNKEVKILAQVCTECERGEY
jgi:hypothetical protein